MTTSWLIGGVTALIVVQEAAYARNGRGLATPAGDRSQPLLIVAFLASILLCLAAALTGWGARPSWQAMGLGQGVFLLGWVLRVTAIRQLGRFFTAHVTVAADQPVIDTGVYRWVRHPGYLGAIAEVAGCALMTGSVPAWCGLVLGYLPALIYRIRVEERALLAHLGPAYAAYQARTWRLLPFCF